MLVDEVDDPDDDAEELALAPAFGFGAARAADFAARPPLAAPASATLTFALRIQHIIMQHWRSWQICDLLPPKIIPRRTLLQAGFETM